MTAYNIAVIFAPTLFKPKTYKDSDLLYAVIMVKVLEEILKN